MITCQHCKSLNYDDMTYCFACRRPMYPCEEISSSVSGGDKLSSISSFAADHSEEQQENLQPIHRQERLQHSLSQSKDARAKTQDEDYVHDDGMVREHVVQVRPYKNQLYKYIPSKRSVLVGNSKRCDIVLPELAREKEVARIYLEQTYALVEQIDEQTTVVIDGEPATGITYARHEEPIYIGKSSLTCMQRLVA